MTDNTILATVVVAFILMGGMAAVTNVMNHREEARIQEQCLQLHLPCECACAGFTPETMVFIECACPDVVDGR